MRTKKSNVGKSQIIKSTELTLFDRNNKYDPSVLENIGRDGDMLSLTDLWKAAGSPANKRPIDWQEKESTKEFIDALSDTFNSAKIALLKTKRGRNAGTYGVRQASLAYAKWIDPALHILVNEVFFQRVEEEKNPDLLADRLIATYKKKGMDDKWIGQRLKSRVTRNEFTACLAAHGVNKDGFADCTNAIYKPLWGGKTDIVRVKKNLDEKVNLRDHMTFEELTAVEFAEMLSKNQIKANNLNGNTRCKVACSDSSQQVARLIVQSKTNNRISI